jgi:hypothetical protein
MPISLVRASLMFFLFVTRFFYIEDPAHSTLLCLQVQLLF